MSLRVCTIPGCPTLSDKPRCDDHRRQHEQARGTRQQRGYDAAHDRIRRYWAPKVASGTVKCARCEQVIPADQPWDLGHRDDDRTRWSGPEHVACNRATASRTPGV